MLNIKSIRPIYTRLITTADKYEADQFNGLIVDPKKAEGRYKEYQKVVRVGSSVREVSVGDTILIDPSRYMKRKFSDNSLREDFVDNPIISIDIPTVTMDGVDYFMIEERDIAYVIEASEEVPDPKPSKIIMPKQSKFVAN